MIFGFLALSWTAETVGHLALDGQLFPSSANEKSVTYSQNLNANLIGNYCMPVIIQT